MKKLAIKKYFILFIMVQLFISCDKFKDSTDYTGDEPVKEIVEVKDGIVKYKQMNDAFVRRLKFSKKKIILFYK